MNKFDKILNNKAEELLEYSTNPAISQAVNDIRKAIKSSGMSNPNSKELADELFDTTKESDSPLKSAFNKINQNPENPNLSQIELQAFLNISKKINPDKSEETDEEQKSEYKSTTNNTQQTVQKTQQPNAKQYNPLNQQPS